MKIKTILVGGFLAIGSLAFAQTSVKTVQLPQTSQGFLNTNFSNNTVTNTKVDTKRNVVDEYEVYLDNGVKVEFDRNGNWKEVDGKGTAIPTEFINQNIVSYVNTQYPNAQIYKVEKERKGYEVKLTNGLELKFNHQGAFLRIDK